MKHITSFVEENQIWNQGYTYVIGIDEVGWGAFAGPVVVGAVAFSSNNNEQSLFGVTDSKLLNALQRENLCSTIKKNCIKHAIAESSVETINQVGIGKATFLAMAKAINQILRDKDTKILRNNSYILVDGFKIPTSLLPTTIEQKAIVKGDQKCLSIAAASILAKVHRDDLMTQLSDQYKEYGFQQNKGYGTLSHRNAIKQHGLSKVHRTSFALSKYL